MTTIKEDTKHIHSKGKGQTYVEYFNAYSDTMTNVVGYVRTSTTSQKQSIDQQIFQIEEWCKTNNHNLVNIYVDFAISGTKPAQERKGLEMLLERLREGDMVASISSCRLCRNVMYAKELLDKHFLPNKIKVIMLDSQTDITTKDGRDLFIEEVTKAEHYVVQVKQRLKNTYKYMCSKFGGITPPYGWKRSDDGKKLVEVPEEQRGIEYIKILVAWNPTISIKEIIKALEDPVNQIPAHNRRKKGKRPWYPDAVRNLLRRHKIRDDPRKSTRKRVNIDLAKNEHQLLTAIVAPMLEKEPTLSALTISKRLKEQGLTLESKRPITEYRVRTTMINNGIQVDTKDPEAEAKVASFIKDLRSKEPSIRVAEIIRRITPVYAPLRRAKAWHHNAVVSLMKKYNIPDRIVDTPYSLSES